MDRERRTYLVDFDPERGGDYEEDSREEVPEEDEANVGRWL